MCSEAIDDDFWNSKIRWYDFPALLFYHHPIRCGLCGQRYYALNRRRKLSLIPYLWMHYLILVCMLYVGGMVLQSSSDEATHATRSVSRTDSTANR